MNPNLRTSTDSAQGAATSVLAITQSLILKKLESKKEWLDVYDDEDLRNRLLTTLPRMKEAFEDLQIRKDTGETVPERIIQYLRENGDPEEYDIEDLEEKYLLIDWIACQLCFSRPIKTKQLFLYGPPSTQKTHLCLHLHMKANGESYELAADNRKRVPSLSLLDFAIYCHESK
ncbi:hypothetical protein U1Q18_041256 [Sarracenia purpurea var. burkii]